jgi:hypothetical protein
MICNSHLGYDAYLNVLSHAKQYALASQTFKEMTVSAHFFRSSPSNFSGKEDCVYR